MIFRGIETSLQNFPATVDYRGVSCVFGTIGRNHSTPSGHTIKGVPSIIEPEVATKISTSPHQPWSRRWFSERISPLHRLHKWLIMKQCGVILKILAIYCWSAVLVLQIEIAQIQPERREEYTMDGPSQPCLRLCPLGMSQQSCCKKRPPPHFYSTIFPKKPSWTKYIELGTYFALIFDGSKSWWCFEGPIAAKRNIQHSSCAESIWSSGSATSHFSSLSASVRPEFLKQMAHFVETRRDLSGKKGGTAQIWWLMILFLLNMAPFWYINTISRHTRKPMDQSNGNGLRWKIFHMIWFQLSQLEV